MESLERVFLAASSPLLLPLSLNRSSSSWHGPEAADPTAGACVWVPAGLLVYREGDKRGKGMEIRFSRCIRQLEEESKGCLMMTLSSFNTSENISYNSQTRHKLNVD